MAFYIDDMLNFKPHTREDVELRVKWLNDPASVLALENYGLPTSLEKENSWFDSYKNNPAKKFFTIYNDDKPIGFMGLTKIDREAKSADIFILIGEDEDRGKGYGKFCLEYLVDYGLKELGIIEYKLEVNKKNKIAIDFFRDMGFKNAGQNKFEYKLIKKV